MTIAVTGGAGYIGSHTVQELLKSNFRVVVIDNLSTGFRDSVPLEVPFFEADVRDTKKLSSIFKTEKVEAVIHFAAKLIVPESIQQPTLYYENNVGGICSLINASKENQISKIVFSSTAAVYGEPPSQKLISETDLTKPINPYGESKLMCEKVLKDSDSAYGIKSICLRYFNVAGAALDCKNGQKTKNATHLIKVASELACGKRNEVQIFGTDYPTEDGTCVRDYIHVVDLAQIHVLALLHLNRSQTSDVFNCGYGEGHSVKKVLTSMEKVAGKKLNISIGPRRIGDPSSLVADNSKLKAKLNWSPQFQNLELICKSAFDWEKSQS